MNLGQNIKDMRTRMNLTQPELSMRCGWAGQTRISNYEKGVREPKISDLYKLANALQCTPCQLLGNDDRIEERGNGYESEKLPAPAAHLIYMIRTSACENRLNEQHIQTLTETVKAFIK